MPGSVHKCDSGIGVLLEKWGELERHGHDCGAPRRGIDDEV